jgi:hypothetical protein
MKTHKETNNKEISRKDALKKIGDYGKYAALTAMGTFLILNPKKAQAMSPSDPVAVFNKKNIYEFYETLNIFLSSV